MGREGADKRMEGRIYVAVVQAVILFGYETWLLDPHLDKALRVFHHWMAWRIVGMVPKRQPDGMWAYLPIGAALEILRLEEIGVYISFC